MLFLTIQEHVTSAEGYEFTLLPMHNISLKIVAQKIPVQLQIV